jgi:hypothetical protein
VTSYDPISVDILIYRHEKPIEEGNQFIRYAYNYAGVSVSKVLKFISSDTQCFLGGGNLTQNVTKTKQHTTKGVAVIVLFSSLSVLLA